MQNINTLLISLAERKSLMIRTECLQYHTCPGLGNLMIDTWKHSDPKKLNFGNLMHVYRLLGKLYGLTTTQSAILIYDTAAIACRYEARVEELLRNGH
ncbi:hypothetical protein JYQ62_16010 [Nostoc sp. UHCC 0702]|nr:hypothetical protein JYQ62_16010 [Nostoc sp. UHCC 0702]